MATLHLVDIVQEYTYLGIKITPIGFTIAQKNLCEKAQRAIFKIQKYAIISKLPFIYMNILSCIALPCIVLYCMNIFSNY